MLQYKKFHHIKLNTKNYPQISDEKNFLSLNFILVTPKKFNLFHKIVLQKNSGLEKFFTQMRIIELEELLKCGMNLKLINIKKTFMMYLEIF